MNSVYRTWSSCTKSSIMPPSPSPSLQNRPVLVGCDGLATRRVCLLPTTLDGSSCGNALQIFRTCAGAARWPRDSEELRLLAGRQASTETEGTPDRGGESSVRERRPVTNNHTSMVAGEWQYSVRVTERHSAEKMQGRSVGEIRQYWVRRVRQYLAWKQQRQFVGWQPVE
ncbi:hypothetical protein B0H21DRAFT_757467 [Amylocystis lapponica]|nr:hypothetical protein B0H21DRAFT_757467 [Amylocystis lapponica]